MFRLHGQELVGSQQGRYVGTSAVSQRALSRRRPSIACRPSVELPAESVSTSSAPSCSLADVGTRLTLERLEKSFVSNRPGETSYVWLPDVYLANAVEEKEKPQREKDNKNKGKESGYWANVGDAIRTLRDDIPNLFSRDLNYDIYREDIVFKDRRNSFQGKKDYKVLFWSLRFHGRIFFSKLTVDVQRVWQPEDGIIKMRWTVRGVPRVPWEAEGIFDGISTYKLDKDGKIYEHSVDNLILRDPPLLTSPGLLAGLNFEPSQTPQLGLWFTDEPENSSRHMGDLEGQHQQGTWLSAVSFSWVRLYAALLAPVKLLSAASQAMGRASPLMTSDA